MYAWARTGREHENNRASPCSETCNSGVSGTWKAADSTVRMPRPGPRFKLLLTFLPPGLYLPMENSYLMGAGFASTAT